MLTLVMNCFCHFIHDVTLIFIASFLWIKINMKMPYSSTCCLAPITITNADMATFPTISLDSRAPKPQSETLTLYLAGEEFVEVAGGGAVVYEHEFH
jgi:maltodextrin utilization protein YvdJ